VNLRREFFRASPAEVKEQLLELAGELLEFSELPEALEFHQSQESTRPNGPPGVEAQPVSPQVPAAR
jgi:hypothetical protein